MTKQMGRCGFGGKKKYNRFSKGIFSLGRFQKLNYIEYENKNRGRRTSCILGFIEIF